MNDKSSIPYLSRPATSQIMTKFLNRHNPIHWNPFNKVVQDHRNGIIIQPDTDTERAKRGLPVPWTQAVADKEVHEPEIP